MLELVLESVVELVLMLVLVLVRAMVLVLGLLLVPEWVDFVLESASVRAIELVPFAPWGQLSR